MTTVDTNATIGTVAEVDPRAVVLDANVRTDARLDKAFVASIREHGVMQPVVGYRAEDGTVHVLQGQRRTLGAIEAERPTVPVYLAASPDEANRIVGQIIENDHRTAFTDHERAAGYEQLSLLGMSAAQIARQTQTPKARVTQALTARAHDSARTGLEAGLTIEQAAVVADLGDDDEKVQTLMAAGARGGFEHTAQRMRDDRDRAQRVREAHDDLTAKGITVLDEAPWGLYYDGRGEAAPLSALGLTDEDHAACPGHAAVVIPGWNKVTVTALCTAWRDHGHENPHASTNSGPMTDEEKAERRRIIENNRAWRSATEVRRQWLTDLARRKSAPKDAGTFLAQALTDMGAHAYDGTRDRGGITTDLLGQSWRTDEPATPAKGLLRALVIALAGYEATYSDVHTWRNHSRAHAAYLAALVAWGYTPSDLEADALLPTGPAGEESAEG